ncbi:MAG: DNA translocase FtsK, partial [Spirochaetia bacterium]|nr:DNA translocase FtsK [Spirochaetia bacterium]
MQAEIDEKILNQQEEEPLPDHQPDMILKKPGFHEVFGSILGVSGLLLLLSLVSYNPVRDSGGNLIGKVGYYTSYLLFYIFGNASYIIPPYILMMGYFSLRRGLPDPLIRFLGLFIMLLASSLFINSFDYREDAGLVGRNLGDLLGYLFGFYGSLIITGGLLITSVFMSSQIPSRFIFENIYAWLYHAFYPWLGRNLPWLFIRKPVYENQENSKTEDEDSMKIQKDMSDYKPWFEKIEEIEEIPENEYDDRPDDQHPDDHFHEEQFERKIENSRLENLLSQLDRKYNPEQSDLNGDRNVSGPDRYFSGRFSSDESRYIFHSSGAKSNRPRIFREPDFAGSQNYAPVQNFSNPPSVESAPVSVFESIDPGEVVDFNSIREAEISREELEALRREFYDETSDEADFEIEESFEKILESEHLYAGGGEKLPEEPLSDEDDEEYAEVCDQASVFDLAGDLRQARQKPQEENPITELPPVRLHGRKYYIPPELLNPGLKPRAEDITKEVESTKMKLESVMRDYGIQASVVAFQRGPIVTLYEIKLEPGVKVAKVNGIYDEIKMNLAASSLRIIAPIPGKSTIGVEIPNQRRESVELGQMIRNDAEFFSRTRELSISLGKNITGENVYVDLVKLPHLLIAGATGAGKSVYMNAVIASLLYTHSPEELRFIMIDPKMVELKLYDGIPHLLMSVITDVRKASRSLQWAVQEMERRYLTLSRMKVRDIRSYNAKISRQKKEKMPYIVILIDELSDLMMVAAKDVEDSIIRLTQKARAVGIHMIMATQRPSVDVITALIKANCPARISFQ